MSSAEVFTSILSAKYLEIMFAYLISKDCISYINPLFNTLTFTPPWT